MIALLSFILVSTIVGFTTTVRRLSNDLKQATNRCNELKAENSQLRHHKSVEKTKLEGEKSHLERKLHRFMEQHP